MGAYSGPKIPFENSTEYFDLNSIQCLNPSIYRNHLYSKWYCFLDLNNVRYVILESGASLYSEDLNGNVEKLITSSTDFENGSINVEKGKYYFSDGLFSITLQGNPHRFVPMTLLGNYFLNNVTRNTPKDFQLFSPFQDALMNVYLGGNGIDNPPIDTFTITKNDIDAVYTANTTGVYLFETDVPIIMSSAGGSDKAVMPPMEKDEYIYIRSIHTSRTYKNSSVDYTFSNKAIKDDSFPATVLAIADSAGGDMEFGIAHKYLCDTYIFPEDITNYTIICPNENEVTVEYYDSGWVSQNTHSLSGTISQPDSIEIGDRGGADSEIAGASNKVWRFSGTDIFMVVINDSAADEESLYNGYMRNDKNSRKSHLPKYGNVFRNVAKNSSFNILPSNHTNLILFDEDFNYFEFYDGKNTLRINDVDVSNNWTLSTWVYLLSSSQNTHLLTSKNSQDDFACKMSTSRVPFFYTLNNSTDQNGNSLDLNKWYNVTYTYDGTTLRIYLNGVLNDSKNLSLNLSSYDMIINGGNDEFNDFRISNFGIFNASFTEKEVFSYYASFRKRFT